MSAMASRRFTAAVAADDKRRAAAQRRAAERRAYARLHCNRCDTQLLTPARYCPFCASDGGKLAAELDLKTTEPAAHTAGSTTRSEQTR